MNHRPPFLTVLSALTALAALHTGCAPKIAPPETGPTALPDTAAFAPPPRLPTPYAERTLRTRSNVRAEPTTAADILVTLSAGSAVGLVRLDQGWYSIVAEGVVGWVWAPLVEMTESDRWDASLSAAKPHFPADSLFVAAFRDERRLKIILDIAWRDLTKSRKERIVTQTGDAWKRATEQMGITPAPEISFLSNNDIEMARWHAFWGTHVKH